MSDIEEVRRAIRVLNEAGTPKEDIIVLHCITEYPAPVEEANLRAMLSMGDELGVSVGYSDHTPGIEVSVAAVALGAEVIEKHFTLDRNMEGPDHRASLEPKELSEMIKQIRNIESALGDGIKKMSPSEEKNRRIARKKIVAACDIAKGDILSEDNLTVKRVGEGMSPVRWDEVIGKIAIRDFGQDEAIEI